MKRMEYVFSFFMDASSKPLDYEKASSAIRDALPICAFASPSSYFPIPLNAPAEIPRMQMIRPDNLIVMTFSSVKIDFAVNDTFLNENNLYTAANTNDIFKDIFETLTGELNLKFNRIAIISRSYTQSDTPEEYISRKFLTITEPINGLSLNYSVEKTLGNKKINIAKDFSAGFLNVTGQKIVIINHEINNHPDGSVISKEFAVELFERASIDIDTFSF